MSYEIRAVNFEEISYDKEKNKVVGRAVPFGSFSKPMKTKEGTEFREVIAPSAFDTDLSAGKDIIANYAHNDIFFLGRTSANTLKLEKRDNGLYVEIDLPETYYTPTLKELMSRNELRGFSFEFKPRKGGSKFYKRGGEMVRELTDIEFRAVSLVINPAYEGTSAELRDADFAEETPVETRSEKTEEEKRAEQEIANKAKHANEDIDLRWKLVQHTQHLETEANLSL